MAISVEDLSALDVTEVQTNMDALQALVQELNPDIDLKRGVLHDLLLYLSAVLATSNQENIDLVRQSSSLQAISEDPELADDDVLDRLASNYLITRNEGTEASGSIAIVIDTLVQTVIASGATFTAGGMTFITERAYVGRTNENQLIDDTTDVLISEIAEDEYRFVIPVVATDVGTVGNLARGTLLTATNGVPNLVRIYAAIDFTGGTDAETNTELNARLGPGITSKTTTNNAGLDALIKSEFTATVATSAVGFGDAEQIRYHSVLPVAFGGRTDVYVRTSEGYHSVLLDEKQAELVEKTYDNRGIWQVSIDRDEAPGFFMVDKITQVADAGTFANGYTIASDERSFDLTENTGDDATASTTFFPDIEENVEAVYSRYQTAVIQFTDSDTDTSDLEVGDTAEYAVALKAMPNILEIQDLLSDSSVRNLGSDCLVKAPVPVFVTIAISVNVKRNTTEPEEEDIQNAVADSVNSHSFVQTLTAAKISAAVQSILPTTSAVASMSISCSLRKPSGTYVTFAGSTSVSITDDESGMVSAKTCCFITNPADVTVSLVTVDQL